VERKLRHGGKWQRRLAPTVKGGTREATVATGQ
jgi:hypothetical protein